MGCVQFLLTADSVMTQPTCYAITLIPRECGFSSDRKQVETLCCSGVCCFHIPQYTGSYVQFDFQKGKSLLKLLFFGKITLPTKTTFQIQLGLSQHCLPSLNAPLYFIGYNLYNAMYDTTVMFILYTMLVLSMRLSWRLTMHCDRRIKQKVVSMLYLQNMGQAKASTYLRVIRGHVPQVIQASVCND